MTSKSPPSARGLEVILFGALGLVINAIVLWNTRYNGCSPELTCEPTETQLRTPMSGDSRPSSTST